MTPDFLRRHHRSNGRRSDRQSCTSDNNYTTSIMMVMKIVSVAANDVVVVMRILPHSMVPVAPIVGIIPVSNNECTESGKKHDADDNANDDDSNGVVVSHLRVCVCKRKEKSDRGEICISLFLSMKKK